MAVSKLGAILSSADTNVALQTGAMTDKIMNDTAFGDDVIFNTGAEGQRYNIRHGTAGAPVTTAGATLKISRIENITAGVTNGADFKLYATLLVQAKGGATNSVMTTALAGHAESTSASTYSSPTVIPDACGVAGRGIVTAATATGVGIGGYFEGIAESATTGKATGLEVQVKNATASTFVASAFNPTTGIWLRQSAGSVTGKGLAIAIGNPGSSQFEYGLVFLSQTSGGLVGGVSAASIRDDGNATRSILINGAHATAAIGIAAGSGYVGIGTIVPTSSLHIGYDTAGAAGTTPAEGIQFYTDVNLFRGAADTLKTDDNFQASSLRTLGTAGGGFLMLNEQSSDPAAPPTDTCRVFAKDVGTKTALMVRFPTGATVQIAIEP